MLDQQTFDGFCYRVDMSLRPFLVKSGPLVMSYAALKITIIRAGRDWERYAMIKARVMGREMYSVSRAAPDAASVCISSLH